MLMSRLADVDDIKIVAISSRGNCRFDPRAEAIAAAGTLQRLFFGIDTSSHSYTSKWQETPDNSLPASSKAPILRVHRRVAFFIAADVFHPGRLIPLRPCVVSAVGSVGAPILNVPVRAQPGQGRNDSDMEGLYGLGLLSDAPVATLGLVKMPGRAMGKRQPARTQ